MSESERREEKRLGNEWLGEQQVEQLYRPMSLRAKGLWVALALMAAGAAIVWDTLYNR